MPHANDLPQHLQRTMQVVNNLVHHLYCTMTGVNNFSCGPSLLHLQDILQQCDSPPADARCAKPKVVARVGWVAALLGLTPLAEACASRAAGAQGMGPRTWADLIRAQQQIAMYNTLRYCSQHAQESVGSLPFDSGLLILADLIRVQQRSFTAADALCSRLRYCSHRAQTSVGRFPLDLCLPV